MSEKDPYSLLRDSIEIHLALTLFQNHRQLLALSQPHGEQPFSTLVLQCDQEAREFILDRAVATNIALEPQVGDVFELEGAVSGIHHKFTEVIYIGPSNIEPIGHRFHFPTSVYRQQRRQSYRTPIPRWLDSRVELMIRDRDVDVQGRVLDLSVTGLACEFKLEDLHHQQITNDQLDHRAVLLSVVIGEALKIDCLANIKASLPCQAATLLRLGLEFHQLDINSERLVSRAVVELQRLTRKNQTR